MTPHNPNAAPATQPKTTQQIEKGKQSRMIQGLDLTGLDEALGLLASDEQSAASRGKPLSLSLDKVIEDPDQPRKQFDPETLQALANSITIHGIKSPISVRSADTQGNYRINFGARRRRAAINAGLTEIPAFIDDDHDQYAQVVENIQRDEFKPMEIARFIAKKIANGEKPADIGKRLGQAKQWISMYQSLNALPEYMQTRADAGHISDYTTLYEIGQAHKKHPGKIMEFLEDHPGKITRGDLKTFLNPSPEIHQANNNTENPQKEPTTPEEPSAKPTKIATEIHPDETLNHSPNKIHSAIQHAVTSPELIVQVKGREGQFRLDITGEKGFGFVQFKGESEPTHIELTDLRVIALISKD